MKSESISPRGARLLLSERARADLALLTTAVIWGSAFAAQRVAAAHLGPFLYNGIRFLLGALVLAPLVLWRGRLVSRTPDDGKVWRGGLLAGLILVCVLQPFSRLASGLPQRARPVLSPACT